MTLFAMAAQCADDVDEVYQTTLERYFNARMDAGTVKLLAQ